MNRKSGFIAVIGRPNAGKSTLMNQILGEEISIVSAKAQTTREKVLGIKTEARGQMVFMDTPGIHQARANGINERMVEQAKSSLDAPDLIWYLVDPRSELKHEQVILDLLSEAFKKLSAKPPKLFLLYNKSDLSHARLGIEDALTAQGVSVTEVLTISALRKKGLGELLEKSWAQLPEGPLYYPDEEMLSDRPVRFFVAEKVREQLFKHLGDELPYACAVEIHRFDEKVKPLRIEASILVERDSQKAIVIGQKAQKIKAIGIAARSTVESFLEQKVFLGLKVKVEKNWTKNPQVLARLGLEKTKGSKPA